MCSFEAESENIGHIVIVQAIDNVTLEMAPKDPSDAVGICTLFLLDTVSKLQTPECWPCELSFMWRYDSTSHRMFISKGSKTIGMRYTSLPNGGEIVYQNLTVDEKALLERIEAKGIGCKEDGTSNDAISQDLQCFASGSLYVARKYLRTFGSSP